MILQAIHLTMIAVLQKVSVVLNLSIQAVRHTRMRVEQLTLIQQMEQTDCRRFNGAPGRKIITVQMILWEQMRIN